MADIGSKYFKTYIKRKKHKQCDYLFTHFNKRKKNKINTIKNTIIKCGTIILNIDKTKIMLVQNNYLKKENNIELWGMPKGTRKEKETYADCAIRETYEETGLRIRLKNNMIRIKIKNTYYFVYVLKHMTNILIPIDTKEIYKVKWFDIDTVPFVKINVETKIFLKQKLNFVKKL
jgi:ADP-ribose pyrophosphatase YjhB (NUDIX family)